MNVDVKTFLNLPTEEVAALVRAGGPKVCVFPINGTRRWFMLEYPEQAAGGFAEAYMRITWQRQVELYKLFFDHGIDTLLTPVFGPDLLERGSGYRQLVEPGLLWFTRDQDLLDFYDAYDVRVRVYKAEDSEEPVTSPQFEPQKPFPGMAERPKQISYRTGLGLFKGMFGRHKG